MGSVGLVLGGGGITGAAFHFGTLFALEMATGWRPADADVVIGTSSGAVVGAILRAGELSLSSLIGDAEARDELAKTLSDHIYRRTIPRGVFRWIRHGVMPGVRRPGLQLALGSPALYSTDGIADWVTHHVGEEAAVGWPEHPTIIVAYELEGRRRVAFGTDDSPDVSLADAVAASSAVPMVFEPRSIDGTRYVDGGVATGTSIDLVLGSDEPLDLIVVIAPMGSGDVRTGSRFYEGIVDRLGGTALEAEVETVSTAWPDTDIIVLKPDAAVLEETRPNPMSTSRAVPAFIRTLRSMRTELARPEAWSVLERHLLVPEHR